MQLALMTYALALMTYAGGVTSVRHYEHITQGSLLLDNMMMNSPHFYIQFTTLDISF